MNRAKTSALVLGLIGGSINAFIALLLSITLFASISQLSEYSSFYYDPTPQLLLLAAFIIVCLLNFIGALTCIRRRVAGGVLMLITGILLLVAILIGLSSIADSAGYMYGLSSTVIIAFVVVYMIVEILPIIGAILCFSPNIQYITYRQPYGQPYGQPYQQPQQPYGQPYQQPQQPYGQPYQQPQQPQQPEDKF